MDKNINGWDRFNFRLPKIKDQQKAIKRYYKSGAKTKSEFIRACILDDNFKVVKVDKTAIEYYWKLSEINAQIYKIILLYYQVRSAINRYHSEKTVQLLLLRLEKYFALIGEQLEKWVSLIVDYRGK